MEGVQEILYLLITLCCMLGAAVIILAKRVVRLEEKRVRLRRRIETLEDEHKARNDREFHGNTDT